MNTEPQKKTYENSIYSRKLGAAWVKTAKNGTTFLSGDICLDGVTRKIVIMKNLRKISEKYPDYEIFLNQNEVAKDLFNGVTPPVVPSVTESGAGKPAF